MVGSSGYVWKTALLICFEANLQTLDDEILARALRARQEDPHADQTALSMVVLEIVAFQGSGMRSQLDEDKLLAAAALLLQQESDGRRKSAICISEDDVFSNLTISTRPQKAMGDLVSGRISFLVQADHGLS